MYEMWSLSSHIITPELHATASFGPTLGSSPIKAGGPVQGFWTGGRSSPGFPVRQAVQFRPLDWTDRLFPTLILGVLIRA